MRFESFDSIIEQFGQERSQLVENGRPLMQQLETNGIEVTNKITRPQSMGPPPMTLRQDD
jgi:hypothetical protein